MFRPFQCSVSSHIARSTHLFWKVKKKKKQFKFTSQRSKYFNLQAHDLVLLNNNWNDVMSLSLINIDTTCFKGCLDIDSLKDHVFELTL